MKPMFSNLWLQLLSVTTVFILTLAKDWLGITAFCVYLALWIYNKPVRDE